MPRLHHVTPRYRQHRASGQAVVTLDARDFYLGTWKSKTSRAEYDRLIGEWLANGRRLRQADASDGLTVVELLAAYRRHAQAYYRKNGRATTLPRLPVTTRPSPRNGLQRAYDQQNGHDLGPSF